MEKLIFEPFLPELGVGVESGNAKLCLSGVTFIGTVGVSVESSKLPLAM